MKSCPGPSSYEGTEPSEGYIVKSSPGPALSEETAAFGDDWTGDCPMPAVADIDGFKEEFGDCDSRIAISPLDFIAGMYQRYFLVFD